MKVTSNRDKRRFLKKQRTASFFRKFFISMGIIILVLITAGIIYTWYMGQNVDSSLLVDPMEPIVYRKIEPVKAAENTPVGASIQSLDTPVIPGTNVAMVVRTKPGATCTISFIYNEIKSIDSGLTDKLADEYGMVNWTWTVGPEVPLGTWPAKVLCSLDEKSGMVIGDIEVVSIIE